MKKPTKAKIKKKLVQLAETEIIAWIAFLSYLDKK